MLNVTWMVACVSLLRLASRHPALKLLPEQPLSAHVHRVPGDSPSDYSPERYQRPDWRGTARDLTMTGLASWSLNSVGVPLPHFSVRERNSIGQGSGSKRPAPPSCSYYFTSAIAPYPRVRHGSIRREDDAKVHTRIRSRPRAFPRPAIRPRTVPQCHPALALARLKAKDGQCRFLGRPLLPDPGPPLPAQCAYNPPLGNTDPTDR